MAAKVVTPVDADGNFLKAPSEKEAHEWCKSQGFELLKAEDHFGDTKSGWWCEGQFLGVNAVVAWSNVSGN